MNNPPIPPQLRTPTAPTSSRSSDIERHRVEALVWEEAGRKLLARIARPSGPRCADMACGPIGWLRVLSEWAASDGEVVGTDVDENMLAAARTFLAEERLENATVADDDLFGTRLEPSSFDLVHARFTLAPFGRLREQLETFARLIRPGGWIALEEPDSASWRLNPTAPAFDRAVDLVGRVFKSNGGDIVIGRKLPSLLRTIGVRPQVLAHVHALPSGHPHLRMPLQFLASVESKVVELISENELQKLRRAVENELADPNRWGTTMTLIQAWGQVPR